VNHFLAAVRRDGIDSVPPQLFQAYARYLGLDPLAESELLWIVKYAAQAPTPVGWTEHVDSQGRLFYFNAERRNSWWTHPLEEEHRRVHRKIVEFRNRSAGSGDIGLGGLRRELWQLEAEMTEADLVWAEHLDHDGQIFYFNRRERFSSWTDPRPAIRHRLSLRQRAVRCLLRCPEPPEEEAPSLDVEPDRPAWLEEFEKTGSGTDPWQSPRLLLMESAAECPVCYDPLCTSRPSVLTSADGRRICGHYFCYLCAQRLLLGCPLCRARAADGVGSCRARALPDVEKRPWQWFAMVDVDGDGRLEQVEAVKALEAVLPVDAERLRRALGCRPEGDGRLSTSCSGVAALEKPLQLALARENTTTSTGSANCWWREWQRDGKSAGGISTEAFCAEGGMLQWIVENLGELRRAEKEGEPPVLSHDTMGRWFDFWDSNSDGGLSKSELLRALMKTLRVSGVERRRVGKIRRTIEKCFSLWAQDGHERVSRAAFLSKPNGLGELLLSALFPPRPEDGDLSAGECGADEIVRPASPQAPPPELKEPQFGRSDSGLLSEKLLALCENTSRSVSERNHANTRL